MKSMRGRYAKRFQNFPQVQMLDKFGVGDMEVKDSWVWGPEYVWCHHHILCLVLSLPNLERIDPQLPLEQA